MLFSSHRILEPEVMETLEEVYAYDRLSLKYLEILHNGFIETVINGSPEQGKFLEVGCGTGRISVGIAKYTRNIKIVGIDLSESMLVVAKDNASKERVNHRVQFKHADAKAIPFEDCTFDAVFCHNMLHHLEDPLTVLKEMKRVVKPDGAFFLRDLVRKTGISARLHVGIFGMKYNKLMKKEYLDSLLAAFSAREFRNFKKELGMSDLYHTFQFVTHQGLEKPATQKREERISIPGSFGKNMLKSIYVNHYKNKRR